MSEIGLDVDTGPLDLTLHPVERRRKAFAEALTVNAARRRSFARSGLVGGAIALVAAGCGGDDGPRTVSPDALTAHDWVLDVDASSPEVAPTGGSVTLSIHEDEISGTGPCNGFRAAVTVDGGDVAISAIAQTLRSCGEDIDQAESVFFDALTAVDAARFDDDAEERLVLSGGDAELVFDAYAADELIVGSWRVVNVATADAIEGIPDGVEPILTFADDGTVTVTGLCNNLGSTWTLDGDQLDVAPAVSTMMACEPPEVMAAESSIGTALGRIDRVTITPDTVFAYDADGLIVLVATAEQA